VRAARDDPGPPRVEAPLRSIAPGPAAVALLALALYGVPLVTSLPLIDPDEGLHAAIALEMVESGNWVVPRLLGEAFLDKPILFFLAQAASIAAFGSSEFSVRLPGQLFGLLGALTTGLLAGSVAGRRAGLAAACVQATLAFPMALNQAAVHDVALVPWTNLAMLSLVRAIRTPRRPVAVWRWSAAAGVCLGLAVLTKGLVGVALVGLPVALLVAIEGRWSVAVVAGGVLAIALAGVVAAPWYLAVEQAQPGYLRYFFVDRHLLGFTTTSQIHGHRPGWYYLPVLAAGSLPWLATFVRASPGGTATPDALSRLRGLAAVWLVADLLFLSAAGSKLATYVLPLFPAISLLVSVAWLSAPAGDGLRARGGFARALRLQGIAGALLLPGLAAWAVVVERRQAGPGVWAVVGLIALAWTVVAWRGPGWGLPAVFRASTVLMVTTLLGAYATVFPGGARDRSARDLAEYFNRHDMLPPRLWVLDERVGSFLFYLDVPLRRAVTPGQVEGVALGRLLTQASGVPGTLAAIPEAAMERLNARLELQQVPFDRAGRYRVYEARRLTTARPRQR
jgi:4-amino-4-deoxy-L-arabinose transferase-like glycosyltransferase